MVNTFSGKYDPISYLYKVEETFITFNNSRPVMTLWKLFTIRKIKWFIQGLSICSKSTTPDLEPSCASCLWSWPTGLIPARPTGHKRVIMCNTEVYANECTKNQVCKPFALTDRAVTRDMSVIIQEKTKKQIKLLLS